MTNPLEQQIYEVLNILQESTIVIDVQGSVLGPEEDARAFQAAKEEAKTKLIDLMVGARIDEINRPRRYSKDVVRGYEYDDGYWEAMNQVGKADELRVLELRATLNSQLDKEQK